MWSNFFQEFWDSFHLVKLYLEFLYCKLCSRWSASCCLKVWLCLQATGRTPWQATHCSLQMTPAWPSLCLPTTASTELSTVAPWWVCAACWTITTHPLLLGFRGTAEEEEKEEYWSSLAKNKTNKTSERTGDYILAFRSKVHNLKPFQLFQRPQRRSDRFSWLFFHISNQKTCQTIAGHKVTHDNLYESVIKLKCVSLEMFQNIAPCSVTHHHHQCSQAHPHPFCATAWLN